MAKVKIQGHASGTGILTVTAPNTSTDRTITLPDATGTLLNSDGDGSSLTGISSVGGATGVDFNDNVKARFGTGNDLEIYHDGSNSYIDDTGTGNLLIKGQNLKLLGSNDDDIVFGQQGGAVTLYHSNAAKLATTATGVDVTGIVTDDKAYFSSSSTNNNTGSSGGHHKIQFTSPVIDTRSGWDSSNYYWTVPSGYAGKYLIHANVGIGSMTTNQTKARIYVNSSDVIESHHDGLNSTTTYHSINWALTTVEDLSVGDDVWASFYLADGTGTAKSNMSSLTIIQLT
jgi:hypothetical protein